jgi:hypothetical protein
MLFFFLTTAQVAHNFICVFQEINPVFTQFINADSCSYVMNVKRAVLTAQIWCFHNSEDEDGSRRGSTWPRGYTPCWQVYTDSTRVTPFIPTNSVACMSTSWLLGNVYLKSEEAIAGYFSWQKLLRTARAHVGLSSQWWWWWWWWWSSSGLWYSLEFHRDTNTSPRSEQKKNDSGSEKLM